MDAASHRGIDDIREIRERVAQQPAEGRYKVYILDEAHSLTADASNALLKTLEEPPPHVVFVLCTTDPAKLLSTIRSRCQRFAFRRPGPGELVQVLSRVCEAEKIEAPDAVLHLIARAGAGSYRDALTILDQLSTAERRRDRRRGRRAPARPRAGAGARRPRRPRSRRASPASCCAASTRSPRAGRTCTACSTRCSATCA